MGEKHEKATDVFKKTEYAFAKKTTSFEKAFPEIRNIRVDITEEGEGINDWNGRKTHDKHSVGEYVDCHNKRCYNGGFCLGEIVRGMVYKKETRLETTELCQGYEGSPKGRKKYDNCYNHFEIKIEIQYK